MTTPIHSIDGFDARDAAAFMREVVGQREPVVLRGLSAHWPVARAARGSATELLAYLAKFDRGAVAEAFVGGPEIAGRFFYAQGEAGFNFKRQRGRFLEMVRSISNLASQAQPPAVYIGSTPIPDVLPGLENANPMLLLPREVIPRIWVGNRSTVSTHFDESENLAVVVAGRRRFTLFPPDQVTNLYVGPLDATMAGQPTSMVQVNDPDLVAFPRFVPALAASLTAELKPGDAIYIPTLWWHNVEAIDPFNMLVNYWWRDGPPTAGSGLEAMVHGILSIAFLPEAQRQAWRAMFDHYVFRTEGDPTEHLLPMQKGVLGEPTPQLHDRIRQFLIQMLSRR